jgi:uncharacterized protein YbjT (DUF2867 family)
MNIESTSRERPNKRTVALAGATGLVGRSILDGLLADTSVQSVHMLARRKPRVVHGRLTCHVVDFAAPPPLPHVDEVTWRSAQPSRLPAARRHFGRLISMPTSGSRVPLSPRVPGGAGWSARWARMQNPGSSITG